MQGDHNELEIFLEICIFPSRIDQKLKNKGRIHCALKGNSRRILRPFDAVVRWLVATISPQSWSTIAGKSCAMISPRKSDDRGSTVPQSRLDRATIAARSSCDCGAIELRSSCDRGAVELQSNRDHIPAVCKAWSWSVRWRSETSKSSTRLQSEPRSRRIATVRCGIKISSEATCRSRWIPKSRSHWSWSSDHIDHLMKIDASADCHVSPRLHLKTFLTHVP